MVPMSDKDDCLMVSTVLMDLRERYDTSQAFIDSFDARRLQFSANMTFTKSSLSKSNIRLPNDLTTGHLSQTLSTRAARLMLARKNASSDALENEMVASSAKETDEWRTKRASIDRTQYRARLRMTRALQWVSV